ncbi:hypothetical protein ACVBEH_25225, partial [Roseateles sp. GG27B]
MNMSAMLRQFSIRARMLGAIVMVLTLLLLVGGVGWFGMNSIHDQNRQLTNSQANLVKQVGALVQQMEAGAKEPAAQDKLLGELRTVLKQSAAAPPSAPQDSGLLVFILVLSLSAILVVPLTLLNMHSICTPLAEAEVFADAIAKGDLTSSKVQVEGQD